MHKILLLILVVFITAWTSAVSAAPADPLNLMDFGAVGDGVADDGPALQSALDALATAGGGTLFVPEGRYAIITPVSKDFTGLASSITILGVESSTPVDNSGGGTLAQGLDLVSEFVPKTGETGNAIEIIGLQNFLIKDISFMGTPGVSTDARITLVFDAVEEAIIRHCEFYGLISHAEGGAIVLGYRSRLKIEQSKFLGSSGNSSINVPVVQTLRWKSITVTDSAFVDYGLRPELYGKTGMGTPISWINIGSAEAVSNDSPRREVFIRNVFLDEGAYFGLSSIYQPPSAPIDLVYLTGLRMNVSNLGTSGNYLANLKAVLIEDSRYEWSQNAFAAIDLRGVGAAILDQVECLASANRIYADSATGRLSVINSVYTHLDSAAQTTDVINTGTAEEDPVQYVRQQYEMNVNHAPDPAGHFYWSNRILNCAGDAQCVVNARAALNTYLASSPPPDFSIAGIVTDDEGAPMTDVQVTLSGSQTVATQTDASGHYHFSDLPTSGDYTVAISKSHYTFNPPGLTLATPGSDQTANFAGAINAYTIAGKVVNSDNEVMPGVTMTLSGSQSATATTDATGSFAFAGLRALEGYTVTPSLEHYSFAPPSWTVAQLSADQTSNHVGTLNGWTISGRVTATGDTGLSGVTVTLSGPQTASVTTNAAGDYSFPGLPAGGDYVVTPTQEHYTFQPSARAFNELSEDQLGIFAGTLNQHTISGRVTKADGAGLSEVEVMLSGSQAASATTNDEGDFSFPDLPAGNDYTVTLTKTHYTFQPSSRSFSNLSGDQPAGFMGIINTHAISGRINTSNGSNIPGVTITLSGSQGASITTTTQVEYSFPDLPAGGDYTVTLTHHHYTFQPVYRTFHNLSSNQSYDSVGILNTHTISGRVTKADGAGVPGATASLSGSKSATAPTNSNGDYAFPNVPAGGNYTITLSMANYSFTPTSTTVNDLGADQTADFRRLNPGVPLLVSEANSTRAVAFDSVLQTREPFQLDYAYPWVADRRTRLMFFATNFSLAPGETAAAVTASAEASSYRNYPLAVEYVGKVPGYDWLNCIVVRLWDDMADVGDVLVSVTYRGVTSNRVRVGIGHIGGGPSDDPGSGPTPGQAP